MKTLKYCSSLVLGLLVAPNLDAQVNTVTTEIISTNASQPVTMVVVQSQPMGSGTGGSISPMGSTCTPCPDSAVAWWRGETNALDSLCAHNGATNNSVGYMQGQIGQAFSFGGSGCVDVANSGLIFPNWSIEAWVYPGTTVSSQVWLAGQAYGRQLLLRPGTSGPKVCLAVFSSMYDYEVMEGPEIPVNVWSHVVAVCDSTSSTLNLYTNGVASQPAALLVADWDSGCSWVIGGVDVCSYSGQYFTGGLDEVTIYDAALTSAQVQALYLGPCHGQMHPGRQCDQGLATGL